MNIITILITLTGRENKVKSGEFLADDAILLFVG